MDLKSALKSIKLNESVISTVLGALLIVVVGVAIINFFAKRKEGEVIPPIDIEETSTLPTTHIVKEGEELWGISEKYYGTGYNWVDIVEVNKISNANQITEGETLIIPNVEPRIVGEKITEKTTSSPTPTPTGESKAIEEAKTHIVQSGENLWKIAEKYYQSGYNWVDIASENNIARPFIVRTGSELVIPNVEPKKATVKDRILEAKSIEGISGATYTVEKSDNLWEISVRAYGDGYKWAEIAKENKLVNPNLIHPGNILSLPR